jgi:hypothetical protein
MFDPFSKQFEALFAQPLGMLLSLGVSALLIFVLLRVAMTPERRGGWVEWITGRNGRLLFLVAIVGWVGFMFAVTLLPASYHGALQFVGLLAGFFIFMGFTWSVIGE